MTALAGADVVVSEPLGQIGRLPLLAPLRYRDFRLVWFGESISLLGPHWPVSPRPSRGGWFSRG